MAYYFDIFGTDNFHSNVSDPIGELEDYENYLRQNAGADIENWGGENGYYTTWDTEVVVNSHYSVKERAQHADDWLQNSFASYNSSSACIVFDHWVSVDSTAGWAWGSFNQWGGRKTAMVNTPNCPTKHIAKFFSAHELGHLAGAVHDHVKYTSDESLLGNCEDPDPKATYMHTGDESQQSSTCVDRCHTDYSRDPSVHLDEYSSCARDDGIKDYLGV